MTRLREWFDRLPLRYQVFLKDFGERVGSTFVEGVVGAITAGAFAQGINLSSAETVLIAGLTAAAAVVKAFVATWLAQLRKKRSGEDRKHRLSPASLVTKPEPEPSLATGGRIAVSTQRFVIDAGTPAIDPTVTLTGGSSLAGGAAVAAASLESAAADALAIGLLPQPWGRRLGKQSKPRDTRDFRLAKLLDRRNLPTVPSSCRYDEHVADDGDYAMLLNDRIGDCAIVTALSMIQTWRAVVGDDDYTPTDAEALAGYRAVGRYVPGQPATDRGCVVRDVLNYWRTTGLGSTAHRIVAFAALPPANRDLVKIATSVFGGVYFGFDLPLSVAGEDEWMIGRGAPAERGGWGGHAVAAVGYDSRRLYVVSWGRVIPVTWGFVERYADEAWGVVTEDWLALASPGGLRLDALNDALARL